MVAICYMHTGAYAAFLPSRHGRDADQTTTVKLEYLNEGNANVVYRIKQFKDGESLPHMLQNKLLRLRKDKPFIQSTTEQCTAYQRHFKPLFPACRLVDHETVMMGEKVLKSLNGHLLDFESSNKRPRFRHGDLLATKEKYGLLMTDMTARSGEVLLELKPKWLAQSPDAPKDAVRCRTCALRAQRRTTMPHRGSSSSQSFFCPLALVSDDLSERQRAFAALVADKSHLPSQEVASSSSSKALPVMISFPAHTLILTTNTISLKVHNFICRLAERVMPVLKDLQRHQITLGQTGILAQEASNISLDFLQAMTLRDCVLFIKGDLTDLDGPLETRIADLDLKQAHPDKVVRWRETEQSLMTEGWYTNTERKASREQICVLSRGRNG